MTQAARKADTPDPGEPTARTPRPAPVSVHLVERLPVITRGNDFREITRDIAFWLETHRVDTGLLTAFIQHTSASLVVQENADPSVVHDLITALDGLAPIERPYTHASEGPDDMPAHIRTMVTGVNVAVPVAGGRMMLGRWQGLFVAEHRARPSQRTIALHYAGTVRDGLAETPPA